MFFRLVDFFSYLIRPRDPLIDSLGQQVDACLHGTFRAIEEANRRSEERQRLTALRNRVSNQEEILRLMEQEASNRERFRELQQRRETLSSKNGCH